MERLIILVIAMLMVSCSSVGNPQGLMDEPVIPPTGMVVEVDDLPVEAIKTSVPSQTMEPAQPTATVEVTALPDFIGVSLFEATHLMDPKNFQISLENWPEDVPVGTLVYVGEMEFICEVLFPDQYPDRTYCWGLAPEQGSEVNVRVFVDDGLDPVLEIPFIVPSPGGGGGG